MAAEDGVTKSSLPVIANQAQWEDLLVAKAENFKIISTNGTTAIPPVTVPANDLEGLKLQCQQTLDLERIVTAAFDENCTEAHQYYKHVTSICTQLNKWLREDFVNLDASRSQESSELIAGSAGEIVLLLEAQIGNLLKHDIAHQLDLKDGFSQYSSALRSQATALATLNSALTNNKVLRWMQAVIDARCAAEKKAINKATLDFNTKLFTMQIQLEKAQREIKTLQKDLSAKAMALSQEKNTPEGEQLHLQSGKLVPHKAVSTISNNAAAEESIQPDLNIDPMVLSLKKQNEDLVKEMNTMKKRLRQYKTLVEQNVHFINKNRHDPTLLESGLHRDATDPSYVNKSLAKEGKKGW